ncbi:MAG: hypothetical protein MPL62_12080 [Alphaproteobacteria bacterium]|nr:hypothetical protein [Alphaproteobacteria bacterium]
MGIEVLEGEISTGNYFYDPEIPKTIGKIECLYPIPRPNANLMLLQTVTKGEMAFIDLCNMNDGFDVDAYQAGRVFKEGVDKFA